MRRLLPDPPAEIDDTDLAAAYAVPDQAHVRMNFVSSADGAATVDGRSGGLGTAGDKKVFGELRTLCDLVLVGGGTAMTESYGATVKSEQARARRRERGLAEVPPLAVVSGSLHLDPAAPMFTATAVRPIVLTKANAPAGMRAQLDRVADVVTAGDDRVDLATALSVLAARGLRRVLCEGGPSLFGSLHAAGLVDELCLTVSPRLAGAGGPRIIAGPAADLADLDLTQVLTEDGALFLRYAVRRSGRTLGP
jgi:riboflavin biosynthesis pyrimidine reductase